MLAAFMRAVILIVVMGVNGASLALTARQWSQVFTNQMKHICSLYFPKQLLILGSLRDGAGNGVSRRLSAV
ncbi:hypothetical protein NBRC116187_04580 [Halopseudomonas sabulinigri]|uniref:Secreted protein n=1 Tax=Halopseudomonas sabulinigri TaxID=472181 RepID=A0ABP9ZKV8_9GAMM